MIAYLLRLLRREPTTFSTEDNMLRIRIPAKAHTEIKKAPVFEIKNPRLEIARRRQERIRQKARKAL